MDRSYAQYGVPSANQSLPYRRTLSTARSTASVSQGHVAALARSIQAGSMNVSPASHVTARMTHRSVHRSPDRTGREMPITIQRGRLPSQNTSVDRRISLEQNVSVGTTDYRLSRPTATMYSISTTKLPSLEKPKVAVTERAPSLTDDSELLNGGLAGLQNLGNTCFMNSVLQCLSNTKPLLLFCLNSNLKDYLNTSSTSVMKGVLMQEYASLIRKMWSENRSMVSPLSFKNTIGKFAPRFTGYSEQDSQEFLRYLLQGLHEDVNQVQQKPKAIVVDEKKEEQLTEKERARASWNRCLLYDNSRLVEIFAGQLKSTLECSYCQYQSITFDMFWDLSIPLPYNKSSTSVQDCLRLFMSKEELNGDEKPTCAKCKQKRPCTKKFSIQKCPEILVLHLKRFSQVRGRNKLDTFVEFPLTNLKLSELTDVMSDSHEGPVPTYNLFGISNHSGTLYSGHYIAQCRHPFTHQWHEFNDASVHRLNDDGRIVSANAYVLFYEQNKR